MRAHLLLSGLLAGGLACGATPALAYFDHYLSGTVIASMNEAESNSFSAAVRQTLANTPDKASSRWTSPPVPRRQPVEATLVPVRSKSDQGQDCRELRADLRRGSAVEQWSAWFCKQPDGQWKSRKVRK